MLIAILHILQWTELWATLLPVIAWLIKRPDNYYLIPVKVYLALVLCLYLCSFSVYFKIIENNHYYYTLVSVCRLTCFTWFFSRLGLLPRKKIVFAIYCIALALIVLNFIFLEDFLTAFSSNTFSFEALILLTFSIAYFLKRLKADDVSKRLAPSTYVAMGLAIYEAICFPMFMFYDALINSHAVYAAYVWNIVQNISYIVFCLFIARAFYEASTHSRN